jgi:hypothetical protein
VCVCACVCLCVFVCVRVFRTVKGRKGWGEGENKEGIGARVTERLCVGGGREREMERNHVPLPL